MWQDEASHLTLDQTNSMEREEKKREERKMRENLQLLSTIYGDRWDGFRRGKN